MLVEFLYNGISHSIVYCSVNIEFYFSYNFSDIPMDGNAMPLVHVEGAGEAIHQIFNNREEYLGTTVGLESDKLTIDEWVAIFNKHIPNKKFVAGQVRLLLHTTDQIFFRCIA